MTCPQLLVLLLLVFVIFPPENEAFGGSSDDKKRSVNPEKNAAGMPAHHHTAPRHKHRVLREHDRSLYDVFVHQDPHNPLPLGFRLSNELVVISFEVSKKGDHPWIYEEAGVREGDRIVAVDDLIVENLADAKNLIRYAQKLTFRERKGDLGSERDKQLHETYTESIERHMKYEHNDGHLDVMEGHLVLFSVIVTIADYSGLTKDCFPKRVVFAEPADNCVPPADGDDSFKGAYVVVRRGGCSFALKSLNVEEGGGIGVIVINHENKRLVMPTDPQLLSHNMESPVVMVSSADGKQIIDSSTAHHRGLHARLAISKQCLGEDARFHERFAAEFEKDLKEAAHNKKVLDKVRAKTSKGQKSAHTLEGDKDEITTISTAEIVAALAAEKAEIEGEEDESIYEIDVFSDFDDSRGEYDDDDDDYDDNKNSNAVSGGEKLTSSETTGEDGEKKMSRHRNHHQGPTERESMPFDRLVKRRDTENVVSGHIVVSSDDVGGGTLFEFLTLNGRKFSEGISHHLGGYLPLDANRPLELIAVDGGTDTSDLNKHSLLIFSDNRPILEQLRVAQLASVEGLIIWDHDGLYQTSRGGEEIFTKILSDDFLTLNGFFSDYNLNNIEHFKPSVIIVSSQAASRLIASTSVKKNIRLGVDQWVRHSWSDISVLTNLGEWPDDKKQRRRLKSKMQKVHAQSKDRLSVLEYFFDVADGYYDALALYESNEHHPEL